jgi:hypothetical protein
VTIVPPGASALAIFKALGPPTALRASFGRPPWQRVFNDDRSPGCLEFLDQLRTPDHIQSFPAQCAGELDDASPNAGVCCVLDDPVTGFEVDKIVKHPPGGGRIHGQHRGLEHVESIRERNHVPGGNNHLPAPVAKGHGEDDLPRLQMCDIRSGDRHSSNSLIADGGGESRKISIGAFYDIEIRRIDRGCQHIQQNFIRPRRREGDVHKGERIGWIPKLVESRGD